MLLHNRFHPIVFRISQSTLASSEKQTRVSNLLFVNIFATYPRALRVRVTTQLFDKSRNPTFSFLRNKIISSHCISDFPKYSCLIWKANKGLKLAFRKYFCYISKSSQGESHHSTFRQTFSFLRKKNHTHSFSLLECLHIKDIWWIFLLLG